MTPNANDVRISERLLEGKHTYSRRAYSCCTNEATRTKGIYRHKDAGEGNGNKGRYKAKSKNEEMKRKSDSRR